MNSLVRLAVPAMCLAALVGCNRRNVIDHENREVPNTVFDTGKDLDRPHDLPGTAKLTGANIDALASESAIDRIVAARCARESACNNIGAGKQIPTRDACTQKLRTGVRDELSAQECPRGVDSKELGECLEAIQKEDCKNPIDTIGRLAACRSSDLCLSSAMPNH